MGKTGKWFRSLLTGRKDQKSNNNKASIHQPASVDQQNPTTPVVVPRPTTPKEKRRWSFRRQSVAAVGVKDPASRPVAPNGPAAEPEANQQNHTLAVAAATAPAADAAEAAAQAAAIVVQLTGPTNGTVTSVSDAAAIKIQSVFRSYLARKALKALRGLVKLQALVRGHLVRKQATATLRCMQALVTAQARARAQRIRPVDEAGKITYHRKSTHRRNSHDKIKQSYHDIEENIKIVEMDQGDFKPNTKLRNIYENTTSHQQQGNDRMDDRMCTYYSSQQANKMLENRSISPAPSAMTDMSPRTCSGHFEDYSFATAQSSPQCYSSVSKPEMSQTPFFFPRPDCADTMSYDFPLYPNYMANTESSRAKARSQSAPKQRPEFERQLSRGRRASVEGRNIPRGAKMQRSSSHVGSAALNYQYPWSVKLDRSSVSLKDSECGSTCSVLTNPNYCRSLVSYPHKY